MKRAYAVKRPRKKLQDAAAAKRAYEDAALGASLQVAALKAIPEAAFSNRFVRKTK